MILIYFVSEKDIIYFLAIWGTVIVVFIGTIQDAFHIIGVLFGLIIIGFLIWVWFGTGYRIENETLKIQSGPFRRTINIQDINRIGKEKNVWSAPALSADRIRIHYGLYDDIIISPKNKTEFIEILIQKNMKIQVSKELLENLTI